MQDGTHIRVCDMNENHAKNALASVLKKQRLTFERFILSSGELDCLDAGCAMAEIDDCGCR